MAVYDVIRAKIVDDGGDGAGTLGPIGSFNHKGGEELVIKYEVSPGVKEEHHIVPYLIGEAMDKDDVTVQVLLAWKYKGPKMPPLPSVWGLDAIRWAKSTCRIPPRPPLHVRLWVLAPMIGRS